MDMCTLVQEQGEMVDRIENNVFATADYVEKAVDSTKKAVKYQSSARRKKLCLGITITIVIIVLIIIIIVSVT